MDVLLLYDSKPHYIFLLYYSFKCNINTFVLLVVRIFILMYNVFKVGVLMKRKLKKKPIIILCVCILVIILIIFGISTYKKVTSFEYRLGKIGYKDSEIKTILKMDTKYINYALENDYEDDFIPLVSQKYFLWKNYKDYISYIDKNYNDQKVDYEKVVSLVNTHASSKAYTNTSETDMNKGLAILVNKYYSLPSKYAPDDIVKMSNLYAYPNNSIRSEVYEAFKEMSKAAKEENITLIVNSSYRSYDEQKEIYDEYESSRGKDYADKYAARPDFSEHQTGLALDIFTPGANMKTFEETTAFSWLRDNAYKYGFILRYPKDKSDITGYSYESWHYRYLGKDLAKKVYDSKLTYDEYYAYYLDK